jgi:diaminopimelate decarboxylase
MAAMWSRNPLGAACFGGIPLEEVLTGEVGAEPIDTPAYIYDLDAIAIAARALIDGFGSAPHLVAYAVKANSAGPIVRELASVGCGADVVSGSELAVALGCGIAAERVLFSGVGKSAHDLDLAIGAGPQGILAIQVESVEELARVEARASALGRAARVSLRINPGVVADTHAHIATGHDEAKFGIARIDLPAAWAALEAAPHVRLVGLSCHVGSQLTRTDDYIASAEVLVHLAREREVSHGPLDLIDFGGGFGIDYGDGCDASPADFARAAVEKLRGAGLTGRTLVVEPGRSLVGPYGVLCARVLQQKRSDARRWLMIDAGMNDLLRPALYGARHRIEALDQPSPATGGSSFRVVGPVCESSDDFGEHRLNEPPPRAVAIRDAGAYGYTMASQYNGRALPTEVFLKGGSVSCVSRPASVESWIRDRVGIGRR